MEGDYARTLILDRRDAFYVATLVAARGSNAVQHAAADADVPH
jgi:hypothetical protein